jgi:nucleoside-diphosphate-sugar epimerase
VVRLRLCTTTGPKSNNETITLYTAPVFVVFPFHQPPVQLLHEDDAGRAFYQAVIKDVSGPFNLGSDWKYTAKQQAKMAGTKIFIYLPVWVSRLFANLFWTLRLIKFDPSWITASLYPVVVDCTKAEKELGWKPKYDSVAIINSIKDKR